METVWLMLTTFRPTVLVVLGFIFVFVVGSLFVWVVLEIRRRRPIRREKHLYEAAVREIQGRERRALERDVFFKQVQEILHDPK